MKATIASLIALSTLSAANTAIAGTMEVAFDNHYEVTINGKMEKMYFNADGTVMAIEAVANSKRQGTWSYTDETKKTMCMTYSGGAAECFPFDHAKSLGDTWQAGPATVTLKPGR